MSVREGSYSGKPESLAPILAFDVEKQTGPE